MRKALLLIGVLLLALGISYFLLRKSNPNENPQKRDTPLVIAANSSAFNRSFAGVLNAYFNLSNAFVELDSVKINSASLQLSKSLDSLHFTNLKADTLIIQTAQNLEQSIQGDIQGLNGEKTMEQKKRELNIITDELYSLIRTVRYDGSIIYHIRCPAVFADSSEAYWLSPDNQICNPYFGKNHPVYKDKLFNRGEVIDSIRFTAQ